MGRILHGSATSAFVDRISMGIPHLRSIASDTNDAVQAQRIPFESIKDALEGSLGNYPELSIPGDVYCYIPM